MRTVTTLCSAMLLLTIGYVVGSSGALRPGFLFAQEAKEKPAAPGAPAAAPAANALSEDSRTKIKAAADALKAAMEALQLEQRYNPATKGMNAFAILSGGCNAAEDLKRGMGVDPETFVALNLDLATEEIQAKIGHDAEGRLTYDGTLVRLQMKSALHQMYTARAALTGEDLPLAPPVKPGAEKKPGTPAPKKPAEAKPAEEKPAEEKKE